jgi:hypothetical protein
MAPACVIASQARQGNFSRTCWITFHWRGMSSNVLTDLHPAAAARAGRGQRIDDTLARQMLGQRTARRLAPFEGLHRNVLARHRRSGHPRRFGLRRS